ncbi:uncharacterized protein LOC131604665 [Vicia villosa]|uniref:uncharacterized protein LOC131604665 n=1 Tax=Vicia villosa TaxID=3911 RepID=UPI00273B2902|nr:uncharacterized protein LOC131604665 [Vicia villosa]
MTEEEESDDDVHKDNDNEDVIEDVNDIGNTDGDAGTGTATSTGKHVVELDDYYDNDLVAAVNPGISQEAHDKEERIPLRKKPTTSKLAASVPDVPIDNISFHSNSNVNRWKYVHQKRLALERELAQNALDCKDIMDLIHAAGLMKTVSHFATCYEVLVKEFIVNFSEECADRKSKSDEAQPELEVSDNKVCQVITTNQVKNWPLKGKLSASKLSMKYAMLHKIGAANWVPTNHKSTIATVLGRFIYVVGTTAKFDYGILVETDSICKRESVLSFHYKLFQGTHAPGIVMTSARTSKDSTPTGKAVVIAILKETCKELESRKLTLEKLIISLEMEEGVAFVENESGPKEDDKEEEASQDDGTEEEDGVGSNSSKSED